MANDPRFSEPDANPFASNAPANPYAPTSNTAVDQATPSDVEAYRRQYLTHEASVKSIGTLYMLGAIFWVPIGFGMMAVAILGDGEIPLVAAVAGLIYGCIGLLLGFTAFGLRRLEGWARIIAIVLSVLGLLAIPIGTLIAAYFLYLLLSEKGQIVFSDNYKRVIEQTPHIKYKTSIIVWILLIILFAVFAIAIVATLLG